MSAPATAATRESADLNAVLALLRDVVGLERGDACSCLPDSRPLHEALLRHLERHGLLPAVTPWAADLRFPHHEARRLRSLRVAQSAASLRVAASTAHAHQVLEAGGIEAINLKGVTLSLRTTGRIDGRVSTDVDVLVARESLPAAHRALCEAGYTPFGARSHPLGGPHRRWSTISTHHVAYSHPRHVGIELHWAVSQPKLLDWSFPELWERRRVLDVGARSIPALGDRHELIHSAVHGSGHRFERLAWLLDFARLARPLDRDSWELAVSDARDLGVLRPLALATRMATEIDPSLHQLPLSSRQDQIVDQLVSRAWKAMRFPKASRPTRLQRVDTLRDLLLLRSDLVYKITASASSAAPLHQIETSRSPGALSFLTVPLRTMVPRRLRRGFHTARA